MGDFNHNNKKKTPDKKPQDYKNFLLIVEKFIKSFLRGTILKLVLNLISSRLKIVKVMKNPQSFLRFGIMCGLFTFLYRFVRYIIRKLDLSVSIEKEVFFASMISSLALSVAEEKD